MNIAQLENSFQMEAKTCGCDESRGIAYFIVDSFHGLCVGSKDIIHEQIQACERLLKYSNERTDKATLEREITRLKVMLEIT